MTRRSLPWRVEHACFSAFPALHQVVFGNWLLQFGDGLSRRANSVNPLAPDCADIDFAIATAEKHYRARGLPTIFRVPSIVGPDLDRALAERGYAGEGESRVLYRAIDAVAAAEDGEVRLLPTPEPEWLAAMARLQGYTPTEGATYRRIVEAVAVPARFALLSVEDAPAALAYGAVHDGLLCYESVIVAGDRRRRGLGRRVIGALAAWAGSAGARGACLQVQADNVAGAALYAGFGLRELYRYHYRRQPSD